MNISTTATANTILSNLGIDRPGSTDSSGSVSDANLSSAAVQSDSLNVSDEVHTLLLKDKIDTGSQMVGFVSIAGDALETLSGYLSDIKDLAVQLEDASLSPAEATSLSDQVAAIETEMSEFIGTLYHDNTLEIELQASGQDIDESFLNIIDLSGEDGSNIGSIAAVEVDFKALISSIHGDHSASCPHCVASGSANSDVEQPNAAAPGALTPLETTITTSTTGSQDVANASGDSNQEIIDTLLLGSKWDVDKSAGEELTYSYYDPATGGYNPAYNANTGVPGNAAIHSVNSINSNNETLLNTMFDRWDDVLGIDFTEVNEASGSDVVGELRVAFTEDGAAGDRAAFAYNPGNQPVNGDIWFETHDNSSFDSTGLGDLGYSFRSAIHEAGHAIGLSHPFGDGSSVTNTALSDDLDIMRNTVMSYTNTDRNRLLNITITNQDDSQQVYSYNEIEDIDTSSIKSYSASVTSLSASTPMTFDILAGQFLYGAAEDTRTGDNSYTFADDAPQTIQTIYDSDGTDTIDASGQSRSSDINLNAGSFSSIGIFSVTDQLAALERALGASAAANINDNYLETSFDNRSDATSDDMSATSVLYSGVDNVAIAYGVEIENAYGGSADDTITGNNLNNLLVGNGGDDTLDGGTGDADIAKFSGARSEYTISTTGGVTTITDTVADRDGTDTIENVEHFEFSGPTAGFVQFDATLQDFAADVTFDLDIDGVTQTVTLGAKNYASDSNTLQDFADDLDAAIDLAFSGDAVGVTVNSPLTITSNSTGASSGVAISNASDSTLQSALGITDADGAGALQSEAGSASGAQYYNVALDDVSYAIPSGAAGAGTPSVVDTVGSSGSSGSSSGGAFPGSDEIIYEGSVGSIDLLTTQGATEAIAILDRALEKVSAVRSNLGAIENRLGYSINNMASQIVNIEASRSNIEDADFAAEMSKFVKAQVLQQAASQLLGRANQTSQGALSLLQG